MITLYADAICYGSYVDFKFDALRQYTFINEPWGMLNNIELNLVSVMDRARSVKIYSNH